jgi:CheY-like chemotaxis protein
MLCTGDVLVVDDEPSIFGFIAEVLTEEGYTVHTARDGASARALLAAQEPDIVLMDLHMPGETGDALIHDLKSDGLADVPVVIMTADATAARELPMDDFASCLIKPFDLGDLLDCVAKYIHRPQMAST